MKFSTSEILTSYNITSWNSFILFLQNDSKYIYENIFIHIFEMLFDLVIESFGNEIDINDKKMLILYDFINENIEDILIYVVKIGK